LGDQFVKAGLLAAERGDDGARFGQLSGDFPADAARRASHNGMRGMRQSRHAPLPEWFQKPYRGSDIFYTSSFGKQIRPS
jgi:hypothetical protein